MKHFEFIYMSLCLMSFTSSADSLNVKLKQLRPESQIRHFIDSADVGETWSDVSWGTKEAEEIYWRGVGMGPFTPCVKGLVIDLADLVNVNKHTILFKPEGDMATHWQVHNRSWEGGREI